MDPVLYGEYCIRQMQNYHGLYGTSTQKLAQVIRKHAPVDAAKRVNWFGAAAGMFSKLELPVHLVKDAAL